MYLEDSINLTNIRLMVLGDKKNIVIWGAGENTIRLFQYTNILKYSIKEIVDNKKYGCFCFGKLVKRPIEINWNEIDMVVISSLLVEEIEDELVYKYNYKGNIFKLYCDKTNRAFYNYVSQKDVVVPEIYKTIIEENNKFKNIHQGERVFILCTGPSINEVDLKKLKNERTIAVSNFYMHKDIEKISPDYYCLPAVVYDEKITNEIAQKWLRDIIKKGKAREYFFHINEKKIIEKECFSENINYLYYQDILPYYDEVDLTKKICGVSTAPILCIQIALYMGFKEIILLGVDYSHYITNKYSYFYNREENIIGYLDSNVDNMQNTKWMLKDKIASMNSVWEQFKSMKILADMQEAKIYNASKSSVVDIFEKIDYNLIFDF